MTLAPPLHLSLRAIDAAAVQRACAGDRKATEALLLAMQRPFYHLALRMLGDRALAEDATQECLLRVITHLAPHPRGVGFFSGATPGDPRACAARGGRRRQNPAIAPGGQR